MNDPLLGFSNATLRFEALLGRGAMGAVYRGVQLTLDRPVAIKVIAAHLAADVDYITRFEREAKTLGKVMHPHVIACHDVGPVIGPDGSQLYVMVLEFVDGLSLGRLIGGAQQLTVRQVLELYRQATEGLDAAHQQGVIHRDIKPDNIMVTRNGQAKVADFGLAKAEDSAEVTSAGAVLGSPAYMSPEACRGERLSAAADVYSLGCSLYQSLCGSTPYPSETAFQALHLHINAPVPSLSQRRADLAVLDPLIAKLLAKDPAMRPDAASVARELRAAIARVEPKLPAGAPHGDITTLASASVPTELALAQTVMSGSHQTVPLQAKSSTKVRSHGLRPARLAVGAVVFLVLTLALILTLFHAQAGTPTPRVAQNESITSATQEQRTEVIRDLSHASKAIDEGRLAATDELLSELATPILVFPDLIPQRESLLTRLASAQQQQASSDARVLALKRLSDAELALHDQKLVQADDLLVNPVPDDLKSRQEDLRHQADVLWQKRHDALVTELDGLAARAKQAGINHSEIAREASSLAIPGRFIALDRRREDLIAGLTQQTSPAVARVSEPAPLAPKSTITVPMIVHLHPNATDGNWLAPDGWPEVPGGRPYGSQVVASTLVDGHQVVRLVLPTDSHPTQGAVSFLVTCSAHELTAELENDGGRHALPAVALSNERWQLVTIVLPAAVPTNAVRLSMPNRPRGESRIWIARAAFTRDQAHAGLEAVGAPVGSLIPFSSDDTFRNTLLEWHRAHAGTSDFTPVRVLWPTGKFGLTAVGHESTMREGMISQLAKATGVKLDAQTVVVGYEHRMDGLRVALEHIAHDNPHLLVVVIPTNIEPTIVSTELANRCTHVGKGIMPLLVFNTQDLHDMHLRGVWRNFIAELRKTAPALPLIDLSEPFECITKYSKGTLETVPNHAFESGISEFIDRIKWQLDSRSTPSHPSHP